MIAQNAEAGHRRGGEPASMNDRLGGAITYSDSQLSTRRQADERDRLHLLANLRSASAKMRAATAELDAVGVALDKQVVDVDAALDWLDRLGALAMFDIMEVRS